VRSGTPAKQKTAALSGGGFQLAVENLLSDLSPHIEPETPIPDPRHLASPLVGCHTPFPKSFLMLGRRVSNSVSLGNNNSGISAIVGCVFSQSGIVDLGEFSESPIF
jgi:hypothetical protein